MSTQRQPYRLRRACRQQRGAALLTAMIIVTLVTTLAASMVWQQWRAIQVETAERARTQASWILVGALDWARLILREDARAGGPDHLGEPWAVPLAEARLSTFLAADRDNNADGGPEAFLSGSIEDANGRYNLRNLIDAGVVQGIELDALQRLCESSGVTPEVASRIATQLREAVMSDPANPPVEGTPPVSEDPPLMPHTVRQLRWLGIDPTVVARLERFVTLLPTRTAINVNTAPAEVIAAVLGVDLGSAERVVAARQRSPLGGTDDLKALLSEDTVLDPARIGTQSNYFIVQGRLRLGTRIVEERSLVERRDRGDITPVRRERVNFTDRGS